MGTANGFEKEKLILAMLYTDVQQAKAMETLLVQRFGPIDVQSGAYSFSAISHYYDVEMGGTVSRILFSFLDCRDPSELAGLKIQTNAMEQAIAIKGNRRVNLDPGFLSCGRLTLATTKNAGHRIPLQNGIYAELTLFYARQAWHPFPWTYMDFQTETVKQFLSDARRQYMRQRKEWLTAEAE